MDSEEQRQASPVTGHLQWWCSIIDLKVDRLPSKGKEEYQERSSKSSNVIEIPGYDWIDKAKFFFKKKGSRMGSRRRGACTRKRKRNKSASQLITIDTWSGNRIRSADVIWRNQKPELDAKVGASSLESESDNKVRPECLSYIYKIWTSSESSYIHNTLTMSSEDKSLVSSFLDFCALMINTPMIEPQFPKQGPVPLKTFSSSTGPSFDVSSIGSQKVSSLLLM